jgi:HD-GYP domain-containing protein (c-di-GMP phosphodiesterase class II)
MAVFQISPSILRVGHPVPVGLRDAAGHLLVPRGTMLVDEAQRQRLIARGLFVDASDSMQLRKALAGKLDAMVRSNALLGQIARAVPDAADCAPATTRAATDEPMAAWNGVMLRTSAVLHDPPQADFAARVVQIDREAMALLNADADRALLLLIHSAAGEARHYSVTHALLVLVVCELAARELGWPAPWHASLRHTALTMNLAMTALQDQLALQDGPVTTEQRELIDGHALQSAAQMRRLGVDDELWLQAVEHHHDAPPGPLAALTPALGLARLVRRADIFAARLSPRRTRQALSATAAAQAAYLDEHQRADEAGAAIIKAVGIYPPGSCVRLASNEIGVVLRRGQRANAPVVARIVGKSGAPLGEPAMRDTQQPAQEITGGVAPHEVKLRLNLERLLRL